MVIAFRDFGNNVVIGNGKKEEFEAEAKVKELMDNAIKGIVEKDIKNRENLKEILEKSVPARTKSEVMGNGFKTHNWT